MLSVTATTSLSLGGAWVFTDTTGRLSPADSVPSDTSRVPVTNALIEKRFGGWALALAPEKPNVRDDARCRRTRTRTLAGDNLYCEWHHKLEGHTNRIHVHPPTKATQGRPIVAIFAAHLPLPGD